jgi:hypothetical protein
LAPPILTETAFSGAKTFISPLGRFINQVATFANCLYPQVLSWCNYSHQNSIWQNATQQACLSTGTFKDSSPVLAEKKIAGKFKVMAGKFF